MSGTSKQINKKRLKIELTILGIMVFGVILWRFLPWFFVQPVPVTSDLYGEYKILYNSVMDYDFSKGPSIELEKRLDRAINGNGTSLQLYYNLKARIEYNYHLERYEAVLEDIEQAKNYAPIEYEVKYLENLEKSIPLVYNN